MKRISPHNWKSINWTHKKLYKYNKAFYQRISIEINKLITSLVNTMDES